VRNKLTKPRQYENEVTVRSIDARGLDPQGFWPERTTRVPKATGTPPDGPQ